MLSQIGNDRQRCKRMILALVGTYSEAGQRRLVTIFVECAFYYRASYVFLLIQRVDLGYVGVHCSLWQTYSICDQPPLEAGSIVHLHTVVPPFSYVG